jgi:hypothetical protein
MMNSILRIAGIVLLLAIEIMEPTSWQAWSKNLSDTVSWKPVDEDGHFEIAEKQTWNVRSKTADGKISSFVFTAVRFHLGFYQLRLVNVSDFAKSKRERLARQQNIDPELGALLKVGIRAILEATRVDEPVVAIAPAGFPAETTNLGNFGLLKIDKSLVVPLREDGPSAILCLDNPPRGASKRYEFQIPAFIRLETEKTRREELLERCASAVQVGPRILEDPIEVTSGRVSPVRSEIFERKGTPNLIKVNLGISDKGVNYRPYVRTIFAVDEPNRNDPNQYSRTNARNAYLIVTETPVTLWEIQDMLKSRDFYANEEYAPHWAINLPGGDYAGLAFTQSKDGQVVTEAGNVQSSQSAVLVVTRKK